MRSLIASTLAIIALSSAAACTTTRSTVMRDAGPAGPDTGRPGACAPGVTSVCRGASSIACNPDGSEGATTECGTNVCVPNQGCRTCSPGTGACSGNDVQQCRPDGSGYDVIATCDPGTGEVCSAAGRRCTSPCADAEANNSYIGCEYWPVPTLNNGLDRTMFHFAIAVANPGTADATVTVDRGGSTVATRTVAAGGLETIQLDWDAALQPMSDMTTGIIASVLERNGAYHVVSTLPVTVYQFNPLEYQAGSGLGATNSFSNDASLLLPTHTLTGNYIVVSRPTHQIRQVYRDYFTGTVAGDFTSASPGFLTLVGVGTSSSVEITFTSHVIASVDGAVSAFSPGQTGTFTLGRGDVLQITSGAPATCADAGGMDTQSGVAVGTGIYDVDIHYCTVGAAYDLTGTQIRSTGQLELFSGHNCAFVPFNRWACDHLEEGIFPLETWGTNALVAVSQPLRGEPNVIRVVSGDDANTIAFDPASTHAGTTLDRGEFIEFEASSSFRVTGTDSLTVAQFLVGQDYGGIGTSGMGGNGDPSLSLATPVEQYRTSYTFLAPTTYAVSFVAVSAPTGADVLLDGAPVGGFSGVGGTGYGVTNVSITGGVHSMTSAMPFGIVVYGFGSYTSYMYPGGLDLQRINVPF